MSNNSTSIITHPIKDNTIYIDNHKTILIGAEKIVLGVQTDEVVIRQNAETGLRTLEPKIEGNEIYNLKTQKHSCWFALDLETGKRGWYPGAEVFGTTKVNNVALKQEDSDSSATIIILPQNMRVKILNKLDSTNSLIWYNVNYNGIEGYIRCINIHNIEYVDPQN